MLLECCSKENVEWLSNLYKTCHFIHILDHKLKCQGYITQHWVSEESKCGLLLVHKQFRVVF